MYKGLLFLQAGKIYIADYTYVEPIKRNKCPKKTDEFVVPNCLGLFHSTSSGDFLPIAIQLIPNDKTSIFTPADTEHDWLLAKMFFRTTQSYIHEVFKMSSQRALFIKFIFVFAKIVVMMRGATNRFDV